MSQRLRFNIMAIFRLTTLIAALCAVVKIAYLNRLDAAIIFVVAAMTVLPTCFRE